MINDLEVAALTKANVPALEIAERLGLHHSTVYRSQIRQGLREPGRIIDYAAIREPVTILWRQNHSDRDIAKRMKVSPDTIARARQKYGLPRNFTMKHDREKVARMFRNGATDDKIAEALDVTPNAIAKLRGRMGLTVRSNERIPQEKLDRAEQLLDEGAPIREVARSVGISYRSVQRYFPGRGWTQEQVNEYAATYRLATELLS